VCCCCCCCFLFLFFILVDAYSKWLEVIPMSSATSNATMEVLSSVFAMHGLPKFLVTDNGPQFISTDFRSFLENNGIRHLRSPPYHPSTNGLAERAVQTFKNVMAKNRVGSIHNRVSCFLFNYHRTLRSTTGQTPAELLWERIPCSHLNLIRPSVSNKIKK